MLSSGSTTKPTPAMAGGFLRQHVTLLKYTGKGETCRASSRVVPVFLMRVRLSLLPAADPTLVVVTGISFLPSSKHLLGGAPWCHGSHRILLCHDKAVSVQRCKSACWFLLCISGGTSCQQCLFQPWGVFLWNQLFHLAWMHFLLRDLSEKNRIKFRNRSAS